MTTRAGFVGSRKMFQGPRRTHLTSLGQTCCVVVTGGATELLACAVLRVTEPDAIGRRVSRRASVSFLRVTNAARAEVATVRLRIRGVAAVTRIGRCEAGWIKQGRAAYLRIGMTRRAA